MGKIRIAFLMFIVAAGSVLSAFFYVHRYGTEFDSTLSPLYTLFGHAGRGVSRAVTEMMPIDSMDEKEYGEALRKQCDMYADTGDRDYVYLNSLMAALKPFVKKPFDYRVYIRESPEPNAFALPGGVIFVTRGLLVTLKSESEVMSVLAHETGHIELSHCMDAVRFEMLSKKTGGGDGGRVADMLVDILMKHSFSKTQEEEADAYAFEFLKNSRYDPSAEGRAFDSFIKFSAMFGGGRKRRAGLLRDYFMSHPPMELRREKYSERARVWWKSHRKKRYVGAENLRRRSTAIYDDEWTTGTL